MTNSIYTDEMRTLIHWLKSERKLRHLSMRSLAERMDKPHSCTYKKSNKVKDVWILWNTFGIAIRLESILKLD